MSGSFETAFFFLRVLGRKQLMQVPITSHGVKAALFQDSNCKYSVFFSKETY